jgi:hypothetical protein
MTGERAHVPGTPVYRRPGVHDDHRFRSSACGPARLYKLPAPVVSKRRRSRTEIDDAKASQDAPARQ